MLSKIAGSLCIFLGISFLSSGTLAAMNKPVPFLGPLLGYDPTATEEAQTDPTTGDDFYTDDDFGLTEEEQFGTTSSTDSSEDVIPADDADVIITDDGGDTLSDDVLADPAPAGDTSEFMQALAAVSATELFADKFTFYPANYIDGLYVARIVFVDTSEFEVTESPTDGISIQNVFNIQSAMTLQEYGLVTDREGHMGYVYEAAMQALGKTVGEAATEYTTLIAEQPLFPRVESDPPFAEVKAAITDQTISSTNFNLAIIDLVPDEFFVNGRLLLTIKNSTSTMLDPSDGSTTDATDGTTEATEGTEGAEGEIDAESESTGGDEGADASTSDPTGTGDQEPSVDLGSKPNPSAGSHSLKD